MGKVTPLVDYDKIVEQMQGTVTDASRVEIDGRVIPKMRMKVDKENVWLYLDGRFSICVPKTCAYEVVWFAANAMAIGQGYPCMEAETKDRPFAPTVIKMEAPND